MSVNEELLGLLADGDWHSGQALADEIGVSRAAVWKQLKNLETEGVTVESIKGQGYRIPGGLELLDESHIKAMLSVEQTSALSGFHVVAGVDSTNHFIARLEKDGHGSVCIAEKQTGGKGRRGREWVSPFGRNIYLSLGWCFQGGAGSLEGLSLVVGLATHRALGGGENLSLKWPNDLLFDGRKVAGILIEMTGDPSGECSTVIGIGINVGMGSGASANIDQPWADASEFCQFGRNEIVARLLSELIPAIVRFEQSGFSVFKEEWLCLDGCLNKAVTLTTPGRSVEGVSRGVADNGALLVEVDGEVRSFSGGELSVRLKR